MSGFRRLGLKAGAVVSAALAALTFGGLFVAQASAVPALKVPSACTTFTGKSADALFGVRKTTHLKEHSTRSGSGRSAVSTCTITHSGKTLRVSTSGYAGGFGGPLKCYKRSKLGPDGQVCVSTVKSFPLTLAVFVKHRIDFADNFSKTLPRQGRALYTFALAQYKAFKG
jgi:hypothetical protein